MITSDCSVNALTYKSIYFFSPQYQSNWAKEEKIGQFVNKTHSTVHYIVNKFKYTESIKNEPRKPKRRILSAREKKLCTYTKNPRLSAPKLRGIVENTTRDTV